MSKQRQVPPRASLQWFVQAMENKLRQNDKKKDGWRDSDVNDLLLKLAEEFSEVFSELKGEIDPYKVIEECADLANVAHMLADQALAYIRTPEWDERGQNFTDRRQCSKIITVICDQELCPVTDCPEHPKRYGIRRRR